MSWWKLPTQVPRSSVEVATERRRDPRVGGRFKVRYSGTDASKIVIGYALITDLSRYGFGIEGSKGIKCGMELALFLELPDEDGPMCIPQATVSWIKGSRFGVELRMAREKGIPWLDRLSAMGV